MTGRIGEEIGAGCPGRTAVQALLEDGTILCSLAHDGLGSVQHPPIAEPSVIIITDIDDKLPVFSDYPIYDAPVTWESRARFIRRLCLCIYSGG